MSAFPNFSNIADYVKTELDSRKSNVSAISKMNAWVRVASAVGTGCQITSNPNFPLFGAGKSIYGTTSMSGTIGVSWDGKTAVNAESEFMGFRPKPNITSIEIDEGAGNLSRKATFSITCYTKGQLDTVCKYFLEPGFTIFIEWGWNTSKGTKMFSDSLNAKSVSEYQSFVNVNKARQTSGGHYDNYLGFITGGSVGMNGDTWTVTIKLTGFTELPAYLMVSDNVEASGDKEVENKDKAQAYEPSEIDAETDLGKKRFMMMFNRLPSNRQTLKVTELLNDGNIAHPANFMNFDETVKEKINDNGDGWGLFGISLGKNKVKTEGSKVAVPEGTKLIGDYAYIRFGTLMEIMNQIGCNAFKLANGKTISIKINTKNTVCSAFQKIFSTDKNKLFIPNQNTPKFSLLQAANSKEEQSDFTKVVDNSITKENNGTTITVKFPYDKPIKKGNVEGKGQIQTLADASFVGLEKPEFLYGFLDDLYVNIDFVKGIIETKNFSMKDALYQILNGMSSAAGGLWDFNIIENQDGTELYVADLNMTPQHQGEPTTFQLIGTDSIFIDASLDLDISGAKMNQIIGNRLSAKLNGSQAEINGKRTGLFGNEKDMVLTEIELKTPKPDEKQPGKAQTPSEKAKADEDAKEKNMQIFLSKVGYVPKIDITENSNFSDTLENLTFVAAFNDQTIFESLKIGSDKLLKDKGVSPLMPIKFTGTIHGVSGIKRGDKFKVKGLPKGYEDSGFFQVTAVKHTIDGMVWKTEIEGGFRKELSK